MREVSETGDYSILGIPDPLTCFRQLSLNEEHCTVCRIEHTRRTGDDG